MPVLRNQADALFAVMLAGLLFVVAIGTPGNAQKLAISKTYTIAVSSGPQLALTTKASGAPLDVKRDGRRRLVCRRVIDARLIKIGTTCIEQTTIAGANAAVLKR